MAECNYFPPEEHIVDESQGDMPISTQSDLISNTSENDEETGYNALLEEHFLRMREFQRSNIKRAIKELKFVIHRLQEQKSKLLEIEKELGKSCSNLTNDSEKTLKDSYNYMLHFQQMFKKLEPFLGNIFENEELKLVFSNMPQRYPENVCAVFPILSRDLQAYNRNLNSANMAFEEVKSLMECDFNQGNEHNINHLIIAIDKACIAYDKLSSIVFFDA